MREHAVQHRRGELLGAGRGRVAVEERLRLVHQRPEPLGRRPPAAPSAASCTILRLVGPKQLLDALLDLALGEGVGAVEPLQDLDRVLPGLEVHDHEVQLARRPDLGRLDAVAVELHQHRAVAEGAALVHAAAARGRRDLALVGELHLAAHRQPQVVDAVEGARRQHADRGARGEALLDRQVRAVVVGSRARARGSA